MKYIKIGLICVLMSACLFTGCNSTTNKQDTIPTATITANPTVEPVAEEVTISEQVITPTDDITITISDLDFIDSWYGPTIKMLIENNSEQTICVQARDTSVNGWMVDSMLSMDIAAGKKGYTGLVLSQSSLDLLDIDTLGTIEFYLHIFDYDTWEDIIDSDIITVNTSAAMSAVAPEVSGLELYADNDIIVRAFGLVNDEVFGDDLYLTVTNNTDKTIQIYPDSVSVNDCMIDTIMYQEIAPGKSAVCDISFSKDSLTSSAITDINKIEFSLKVTTNYLDTIADIGPFIIFVDNNTLKTS